MQKCLTQCCPAQEAQLPLYLRPYEVLVTSNRTALIEMVPDTLSLHQLKAKAPTGDSIADHFFAKFVKVSPSLLSVNKIHSF